MAKAVLALPAPLFVIQASSDKLTPALPTMHQPTSTQIEVFKVNYRMQCYVYSPLCFATNVHCSTIVAVSLHPIINGKHLICRWGSFLTLAAFMVKVCYVRQGADPWGPLWSKSAVQDKVLQQGADPWAPLWLKSAAWDKVLWQGADPWGPSWPKSTAQDKVLWQGADP